MNVFHEIDLSRQPASFRVLWLQRL